MNLWLKGHFLFAVLFVSSSALTAEECEPLIKPLSMADPSVMYGSTNFLAGYTNNALFRALLDITHSSRVTIKAPPTGDSGLVLSELNNMNGTCFDMTLNVTIEDDTLSGDFAGLLSVFNFLPTDDGFQVLSANSTAKDAKKVLEALRIVSSTDIKEINARTVYLMGKDTTTVSDSVLDRFKKQASCLGFDGEPNFRYNPDKEFCKEGESAKLN